MGRPVKLACLMAVTALLPVGSALGQQGAGLTTTLSASVASEVGVAVDEFGRISTRPSTVSVSVERQDYGRVVVTTISASR